MIDARVFGARRWVVAGIGLAVGAGAVFGGWGLLSDADGLGAEAKWLDGSPFPDYRIPGLVLLIAIGGGMLLTALLALIQSRAAGLAAFVMGFVLFVWGLVETLTIGYQGAGQIVLLVAWVVAPALPLVTIGWQTSRPALRARGAR